MRDGLDQSFATAAERLKGKSFNDLLSSTPRDRTPRARAELAGARLPAPALAAARLSPDDFSKPDARQNWLMNQLLSNLSDDSGGMDDVVLPMLEDDVKCLLSDLNADKIKSDFEAAFGAFVTLIKDAVTDPEGFKSSGVTDFINAAKAVTHFVIDVAQAIVKALIDLVALIVENIDTVLTHSLDIPLVSTLYEALSESEKDEEDLTLLNACALALGFQFTILYKTVSGASNPPFSDDQVKAIVQENFPSAAMLGGATPGDDNLEWKILFGFWSGIVALSDTLADYVAAALVNADGKTVGILQSATKFIGFINTIALSCAQIMSWHLLPNYESWDWSAMSDEEKWAKGAWVAAWGAPIVNTIWLLVPLFATIPRAELAGQIALTTVGAVNTGVGITAAVKASTQDDEIAGIASALLVNSANTLTPLLMDFVVDLTEGGSPGFKGWADAFTDILGGIVVATTPSSLEAAGGSTLASAATA